MDISTIVVSYNTARLLPECIKKLRSAYHHLKCEEIFIDNASADDSVNLIRREFGSAHLLENKHNVGFGRANNQALPLANGRFVLLLNTDAFVAPDTLTKTVAYMDSNPNCGILGVRLEGRDGLLQPCCRYFPTPWNTFLYRTGLNRIFKTVQMVDNMDWAHDAVRSCDWVVGCYYLVRKEVVEQIGLFDPRYFLYFEEVDHCFAAKKAGWDVVFYPHTTVVHLGGESAKSDGVVTQSGRQLEALQVESELLYFRKNHGWGAVWGNVALTVLADALNTLKRVFKPGVALNAGGAWQHTALVCITFARTRWGTKATR
ncbi:glycosyltransferase family 2 protein [Rhodoferax sp. AJA081-3]|uniref:glycosyltransferase family 2 protein n=1 Tax=Rhodoferax sp. AJA081-3 TaxID=2752316 RepID=UPI001AE0D08E|nr:glycosyltransferase family 2 protein [Rhodoferax sp. AJA081-3]QTN26848.1 glycosyltransferase family 2 protein [Rhodoferax sp. AJA081-3]